ncbi:MAG: hypothetical protein MJB57_00620 [Gemmatimonadetes bacterium]|nr:hypothetical protein [Gemmatimonadota bacterium]
MRWSAVLFGGLFVGVAGGVGQEPDPERIPTIPNGVPAVLFPVQSTTPTPGGAWVGGMATDRETIELLNAELEFAFGEEEGAESWALAETVEYRLSRNPMIKVDPARLAYHGLLREPEPHSQIYEPLHTQLRQVAALFDARLVVLPLTVWYRGPTDEERAAAETAEDPARGRAVLLAAIIDVRRSAVLWHGTIEGDPAEATSRSALTTLALRVAGSLAPS